MTVTESAPPSPPRQSRLTRWWVAAAIAALVAVAAILFAGKWLRPGCEVPAQVVHMTALLPAGATVNRGPGRMLPLALSPDGRTLVIAVSDGSGERLYRRTLDRAEATPMAGTDAATSPFFSPDGASVGFFANRRLKRVPVAGGTAIDIAAAPSFPAGASWGTNDRIVFAGLRAPLQVVDARGGTPEDLMPLGPGLGDLYPEILSDGRTVLFTEEGWIHAFDLVSRRRSDRIIEGVGARYSPDGYLLLNRRTTVLAAPFDVALLKVTGPVLPISEGVEIERTISDAAAHLAVSREGAVAFVPSARAFALVLVEPDGSERVVAEQGMLENPRFSPDGRRLVVAATRNPGERPELWIHDLKNATPAYRWTFDGGRAPVWSRDGAAVTYSYLRSGGSGIYSKSTDGRGDARRIVTIPAFHWLVGWTPNQTLVLGMMEETPDERAPASSIVAFEGGASRRVVGPGRTWGGRLSPDGRWPCTTRQTPGTSRSTSHHSRTPGLGR